MNLYTLHVVHDQERAPAIMNIAAARQELEIPLDHASETFRLGDGEAEAVFVEPTGRSIPEFGEGLRGVAKAVPRPYKRYQCLDNGATLRSSLLLILVRCARCRFDSQQKNSGGCPKPFQNSGSPFARHLS
jgi:hypothetical protein